MFTAEPSAEIASDREGAPPQKKSRLLGDLDLNSAEVQKVLRADSAHSSALSEVRTSRVCVCVHLLRGNTIKSCWW